MNVTVNDEAMVLDEETGVTELLARLGVSERGVAVAVDWAVLPRSRWDRPLHEGARVEIVTAVQGG